MGRAALLLVVSLLAGCGGAPRAGDTARSGSASVGAIVGPTWALVEIQSMDGRVYTPGAPDRFTLRLREGGELEIRAHCNRGRGTWRSAGESLLRFGPIATTRAHCGDGSLHDRFLSDLSWVRSYVLRDGRLYLATYADGAILELRPLDPSEHPDARRTPPAPGPPGQALASSRQGTRSASDRSSSATSLR